MARRRSAFASLSALRSTASSWGLAVESSTTSGTLHAGHRLANPGLSGLSSNSSEQTTQVLIGKAITINDNAGESRCEPAREALSHCLKRYLFFFLRICEAGKVGRCGFPPISR